MIDSTARVAAGRSILPLLRNTDDFARLSNETVGPLHKIIDATRLYSPGHKAISGFLLNLALGVSSTFRSPRVY